MIIFWSADELAVRNGDRAEVLAGRHSPPDSRVSDLQPRIEWRRFSPSLTFASFQQHFWRSGGPDLSASGPRVRGAGVGGVVPASACVGVAQVGDP
jgi:hypothetical protein